MRGMIIGCKTKESKKMTSRWVAVLVTIFFSCFAIARESSAEDPNLLLKSVVERQRAQADAVGMAAVVMKNGEVFAAAASGEREIRSGAPLQPGHKFHLGSITKSFTATAIAVLVEKGKLRWDTTVGDVFENDPSVHAKWKPVTIRQLLSHSSGARRNADCFYRAQSFSDDAGQIQKVRQDCVRTFLQDPPQNEPGAIYLYSNVGIVVAGAMAEVVTNTPWETLVTKSVTEPLRLGSAGFGPPTEEDQPRGHAKRFYFFKVSAEPTVDNPPAIGPAGTLHMSLFDLARFGHEHLIGESGKGLLLRAESYRALHTPLLSGYSLGWMVEKNEHGIPQRFFWHNGSNSFWYALLVVIPERSIVVAVASNDSTEREKVRAAAWQIVSESLALVE